MLDISNILNSYQFNHQLLGTDKQLKVRPIVTNQVKTLLMNNATTSEEAELMLDKLITDCVIEPKDFNISDLYLEDRFYLLVALRKFSKGSTYKFTYTCPKCDLQSIQIVNIDKMKVKKLENLDPVKKLDDNFTVVLNYITRGHQLAAQERLSKDLVGSKRMLEEMIYTHALCIEKIITPGGEFKPSFEDALNFIQNTPGGFYDAIKEWFEAVNFGIDFKFETKCMQCKHTEKVEVPLDSFLL